MKERLLVLAKAVPEISSKYESLVCVAGITDSGEWRRIYPIPWNIFWGTSSRNFKKKYWIEYETAGSGDYRHESMKIKPETIKPIGEASFSEIESMLKDRLTTIEELEELGPKKTSLGVVEPKELIDFVPTSNKHYEELTQMSKQKDLSGGKAVKLDIPEYKYRYIFKDVIGEKRNHENLCEDWEVGELYRNCKRYLEQGKYKNEEELHQKVKEKMLTKITKNGHFYFIVGSHFIFPTYMIVGVVYPRKEDIE
jgi:hypothetical protein